MFCSQPSSTRFKLCLAFASSILPQRAHSRSAAVITFGVGADAPCAGDRSLAVGPLPTV